MAELVTRGNHAQLQHDDKFTALCGNRGKRSAYVFELTKVDDFLKKFEREVPEQQRFDALKWVLCIHPQSGEVCTSGILRTGVNAEG